MDGVGVEVVAVGVVAAHLRREDLTGPAHGLRLTKDG
jgi:hypothetical protein